jgi:hypothetical protein
MSVAAANGGEGKVKLVFEQGWKAEVQMSSSAYDLQADGSAPVLWRLGAIKADNAFWE